MAHTIYDELRHRARRSPPKWRPSSPDQIYSDDDLEEYPDDYYAEYLELERPPKPWRVRHNLQKALFVLSNAICMSSFFVVMRLLQTPADPLWSVFEPKLSLCD